MDELIKNSEQILKIWHCGEVFFVADGEIVLDVNTIFQLSNIPDNMWTQSRSPYYEILVEKLIT